MSTLQQKIEDEVGVISKKVQALKEYTQMVLNTGQNDHSLKLYNYIEDCIKNIYNTFNDGNNTVILKPTIKPLLSADIIAANTKNFRSNQNEYDTSKISDENYDALSQEIKSIVTKPV